MSFKPDFDFRGQQPSPEMDFFIDPDNSLGDVSFGFSEGKVGEKPPSLLKHIRIRVITIAIAWIITYIILRLAESIDLIWEILIYFLVAAIMYFFTRHVYNKRIFYVGPLGTETIRVVDRKDNFKKDIFLFKDATHLTISIKPYKESGLELDYRWLKVDGNQTIPIHHEWEIYFPDKHHHVSVKEYPVYHFCRHANYWWSLYLDDTTREQFGRQGYYDFNFGEGTKIYSDRFLRLFNHSLELHDDGKLLYTCLEPGKYLTIQNEHLLIYAPGFQHRKFKGTESQIDIGIYEITNKSFLKLILTRLYNVAK